jgi:hypothetical protein
MKIEKLMASFSVVLLTALSAQAQGIFQNLNFEQANPVLDPNNPNPSVPIVTPASAFPWWTVIYSGDTEFGTEVLWNETTQGTAAVELFGPNNPATATTPGAISGNYSAFLEGGLSGPNSLPVNVSLAQTGLVPEGSQSMQFEVWQSMPYNALVSFDGNNLSPVVLGTGSDYTLYGVDIAPYAGDSGQLEFTSLSPDAGLTLFGIDDIAFSPNSVPEPSTWALMLIAGAAFGVRRWRSKGL